MLFPKEFGGKKAQIDVDMYEDYGVFGREDIYDLVADWNREWIAAHPDYVTPSEKKTVERNIKTMDEWLLRNPGHTPLEAEAEIRKDRPYFHCSPIKMSDMQWWPFYSDLSLSRDEVVKKWKQAYPKRTCIEYRSIGIEIACYDEDNAALPYPIKIAKRKTSIYEKCPPSIGDPDQGFD